MRDQEGKMGGKGGGDEGRGVVPAEAVSTLCVNVCEYYVYLYLHVFVFREVRGHPWERQWATTITAAL